MINFYPRPPRGGRPYHPAHGCGLYDFYPRPPRGGRHWQTSETMTDISISIHALREEGDVQTQTAARLGDKFLSTPSARRATHRSQKQVGQRCNFYPRPPRGGRRVISPDSRMQIPISIHALREEGDRAKQYERAECRISIHALREEGDSTAWMEQTDTEIFLSTPSARRATSSSMVQM